MSTALEAAAARGIQIAPSGDATYPWAAVVRRPRGQMPLVRVLDTMPELAAAEALAYIRAKGWTPGPAAIARAAQGQAEAAS